MKKQLFLLFVFCFVQIASVCAQVYEEVYGPDFESGGISYGILRGPINNEPTTNLQTMWKGTTAFPEYYTGDIVIPEKVMYNGVEYTVTRIGSGTFSGSVGVTSITFPTTITSFGHQAFSRCTGLTSIEFPENLTIVDDMVLYGCSNLTSITWNVKSGIDDYSTLEDIQSQITSLIIGATVEEIPYDLCRSMDNLQEVTWNTQKISSLPYEIRDKCTILTIGDSITNIPQDFCFSMTNLQTANIGKNVTSIGSSAFRGCDNLKTTNYLGNISSWCNIHFADNEANPTKYSHNLYINNTEVIDLVIPEGISDIDNRFSGLINLKSITLPNSLIYIGENAFYNCSGITELTIPANVDSIGDGAFANLTNLTSVTWNAIDCSLEVDDYNPAAPIFGIEAESSSEWLPNTLLTSFTFGNTVEKIPANLCRNLSALTNITIPTSVTTIGDYAFDNCTNITALIVPTNVNSVGNYAFQNMNNLKSVTWNAKQCNTEGGYGYGPIFSVRIPTEWGGVYSDGNPSIITFTFGNDVEIIPACVCEDLNLQHITIPSTVTTIGSAAFRDCELLETINIPAGVKIINEYAFYDCELLKTIDIPNSVTTIDDMAFAHCSSLKSAILGEGVDTIGWGVFYGCDQLTKFICHSTTAVEESEWDVDEPGDILGRTQLDTVIAPANIFDRSEVMWSSLAKNIRYIQVNSGELTADAFAVINRSFDKLQTLDIAAATNTEIANNAFKGCYKLETLRLPTQLEYIGYMALADCKSLQNIEIPATVTDIDDSAFENCRSIRTVTFASDAALERIGNWAFYNCHEITSLTIPEGVTEIGAAAFFDCVYLENVTLPASLQAMGDNTFAGCSKMQKMTCLATVPPTIERKTFYEVSREIPVLVPDASLENYKGDIYWQEFFNIQGISGSTSSVETPLWGVSNDVRKVLEDGTFYILKPNGERYTMDGRKVLGK